MTMRKLIGVAVYRLNELRNEFLKIDYSEYHYIDGNLVELKVIPHDVQILYPTLNYPRPYEIMEMWEKLKVNLQKVCKKNTINIIKITKEPFRKAIQFTFHPVHKLSCWKRKRRNRRRPLLIL